MAILVGPRRRRAGSPKMSNMGTSQRPSNGRFHMEITCGFLYSWLLVNGEQMALNGSIFVIFHCGSGFSSGNGFGFYASISAIHRILVAELAMGKVSAIATHQVPQKGHVQSVHDCHTKQKVHIRTKGIFGTIVESCWIHHANIELVMGSYIPLSTIGKSTCLLRKQSKPKECGFPQLCKSTQAYLRLKGTVSGKCSGQRLVRLLTGHQLHGLIQYHLSQYAFWHGTGQQSSQ